MCHQIIAESECEYKTRVYMLILSVCAFLPSKLAVYDTIPFSRPIRMQLIHYFL